MIAATDRIELPHGVELRAGGLYDDVRGITVAVNESARVALASAATPAAVADALERRFALEGGAARADAISFCATLNACLLLNVRPRGRVVAYAWRWLALVPALLPLGRLPTPPATRRHVDTASTRAIVVSGVRALLPFTVAAAAVATTVAIALLLALGVSRPALAAAVGTAGAVGIAAHELGHLLALRRVAACVVVRGLRVAVLHRRLDARRQALVAGAGPAAGLSLMALALAAAHALPRVEVAAAALAFAIQALGLTMLTRDGRTLCAGW